MHEFDYLWVLSEMEALQIQGEAFPGIPLASEIVVMTETSKSVRRESGKGIQAFIARLTPGCSFQEGDTADYMILNTITMTVWPSARKKATNAS